MQRLVSLLALVQLLQAVSGGLPAPAEVSLLARQISGIDQEALVNFLSAATKGDAKNKACSSILIMLRDAKNRVKERQAGYKKSKGEAAALCRSNDEAAEAKLAEAEHKLAICKLSQNTLASEIEILKDMQVSAKTRMAGMVISKNSISEQTAKLEKLCEEIVQPQKTLTKQLQEVALAEGGETKKVASAETERLISQKAKVDKKCDIHMDKLRLSIKAIEKQVRKAELSVSTLAGKVAGQKQEMLAQAARCNVLTATVQAATMSQGAKTNSCSESAKYVDNNLQAAEAELSAISQVYDYVMQNLKVFATNSTKVMEDMKGIKHGQKQQRR